MKYLVFIALITLCFNSSERSQHKLRSKTSAPEPCEVLLVMDGGSSGTNGVLGIKVKDKYVTTGIKHPRPDKTEEKLGLSGDKTLGNWKDMEGFKAA